MSARPNEQGASEPPRSGGPLAGLRVVDLTELLPGPFLTQSLADMGAHIVKVERPPHGDNARRLAPGLFGAVNRGKESVFCNLKDEGDLSRVRELILGADMLVESYRPGVMRRLGLDYDSLKAAAPRLIYLSLTGYGQEGPHALLPGHDINYLAAAGALSLSGKPGGPPEHSAMLPIADLAGAATALSALLAALYQRTVTGKGQYLDVGLADSVLHWMVPRLGVFHQKGASHPDAQRQLLGEKPAYGVFRCKDGRYISIAALEEHFWNSLNRVLGLFPSGDARCASHKERAAHAAAINRRLQECVAEHDSSALMALLSAADLPAYPVLDTAEAVVLARQKPRALIVETPVGPLPGFPVRFADT